MGSIVHGALSKVLVIGGYAWIWANFRVFDVPTDAIWSWILIFLGVDLGYYWFHRASHRINFIWAGHVVHHQSEEYNLAVALRQSWYVAVFEWFFYIPLAILGFPVVLYVTAKTVNTLYQFWIHTEGVKRVGPFEAVLNTPSHHRVHHGINPSYVDKNYAGILIVWDRLFGTFTPRA